MSPPTKKLTLLYFKQKLVDNWYAIVRILIFQFHYLNKPEVQIPTFFRFSNVWLFFNCNLFFIPVKIQCPRYWSCSLWIGASRNTITSNFLYNSGKPIVHPKWGLFQPGNEIGNENCGLLLRSGKLHDAGCIFSDFHYICKTKNDVV